MKPQAFWEFREGVRGLSDAAKNIHLQDYPHSPTPIISGNVSFYNESATGRAVAPSPIIACVGVLEDYSKAVTMQLKAAGNKLFLVGLRKDELGGSVYYQALGLGLGSNVPQIDWSQEQGMIWGVVDAIEAGHVAACQDISDGGLAVALAEMTLGGLGKGELGLAVSVTAEMLGGPPGADPAAVAKATMAEEAAPEERRRLRADKWLFSESSGFVMEVLAGHEEQVREIFARYGLELTELGEVTGEPRFHITIADEPVVDLPLGEIRAAWASSLAEVLK